MSLSVIDGSRPDNIHEELAVPAASALDVFRDEGVITLGQNGKRGKDNCSYNGPFLNRKDLLFDGVLSDAFGTETVFMPPIAQMVRHFRSKYSNQDWTVLSESEFIEAVKSRVKTPMPEELVIGVSKKVIVALKTPPSAGGDDAPMAAAAAGRP